MSEFDCFCREEKFWDSNLGNFNLNFNSYRVVRSNLLHAAFQPRSNRLLRHFLLDDVLELFPRQQLFQLKRLANVDGAVRQHAAKSEEC